MALKTKIVPIANKRNKYPHDGSTKFDVGAILNKMVSGLEENTSDSINTLSSEKSIMTNQIDANTVDNATVEPAVTEMENNTMNTKSMEHLTIEMENALLADIIKGLKQTFPDLPADMVEAAMKRQLNHTVDTTKPCVTPEMFKYAQQLSGYMYRASKDSNDVAYYTNMLHYINKNEATFKGFEKDFYPVLKDFCELNLSIFKGEVDVSVLNELKKHMDENSKHTIERIHKEEEGMKEIAKETQSRNTSSGGISGNVKAAIAGSVMGAATSLAWDFVFGTDQTTTEMLCDAGISAGIGAVTGYGAALLADMEYCDTVSSSMLGAAAGAATSAAYRSTMALFANDDEGIAELPPLED